MTGTSSGELGAVAEPASVDQVVEQLRDAARDTARAQARTLRLVAQLAVDVEAEARRVLLRGPRVSGQPSDDEVVRSAVANEVQVVLGMSEWSARRLVDLSARLTRVLPDTLDALEGGRVDLARARALAEATEPLSDELARSVEALVLSGAGDAPWDGPSPRAWRQRIDRAVVRADAEAARRRREQAVRDRQVRSWLTGNGAAELLVSAAAEDVAMAEQVITDLARQWPAEGPDHERLTMDQRRVDALMDLLRRVRDGRDIPTLPVRRQREIGLVLTADTFFADQPDDLGAGAGADPGELRGPGGSVAVDARSAAEIARAEIARGVALNVLLVDAVGVLQRVVRLPRTPAGGWTRELVGRAVCALLPGLPELAVPGYVPTALIEDHVRARHARCVWYDCPRSSARCDLDHDEPWPRGPTSTTNLVPRCRRNHESKTRGLVGSRVLPDGTVLSTMLTGLVAVARPEPLPGFAPGESHVTRVAVWNQRGEVGSSC